MGKGRGEKEGEVNEGEFMKGIRWRWSFDAGWLFRSTRFFVITVEVLRSSCCIVIQSCSYLLIFSRYRSVSTS